MTDLIKQAEALEAQAKELRRQAAERPLEVWLGKLGPGVSCVSPWRRYIYKTQEEATKHVGWSGGNVRKMREVKPVRVTEEMEALARAAYDNASEHLVRPSIRAVMEYTIREICGLEVES